jgi:hypothetical protein
MISMKPFMQRLAKHRAFKPAYFRERVIPWLLRGTRYERSALDPVSYHLHRFGLLPMFQHDMTIANDTGANVRSDINNALNAIATVQSGASAPSTTYAYQLWADTTNGVLKQRNAANTGYLIRGSLAESFILSRSSNTILGVGDFGRTIVATSAFTQTLTAAATLADGWFCYYKNNSTGVILLDPNSSEQIDGATTLKLRPGESCLIFCNGSAFFTVGRRVDKDGLGLLENVGLSVTVGSNNITIALKDADGNDPAPGSPARIGFRSATLTTGTPVFREVTAALSMSVTSGSTLGFGNSESGRLYVYAIDNAGTVELAVFNPRSGQSLRGIQDNERVTTTAEGGAGAADSAQVAYSTTARSNVAAVCLGYFEIQTGATAGQWSNAPTVIQVMAPGVRRTGDIVQRPVTVDRTQANGTTTIPLDNTIPQNTEGTEFSTVSITPSSALNLLRIRHNGMYRASTQVTMGITLFQDSTADAIAATTIVSDGTNSGGVAHIVHFMVAGTTSSTTFRVRAGGNSASTITYCGVAAAAIFGGVITSYTEVEEIFV